MFDVQSVRWSGQAEFHISAVADQKSGQFNQKNYIFVINDVSYEVLGFRSYVLLPITPSPHHRFSISPIPVYGLVLFSPTNVPPFF
jgi:hypothetical protein